MCRSELVDLVYEIREKLNNYSVSIECKNDVVKTLEKLEKKIWEVK